MPIRLIVAESDGMDAELFRPERWDEDMPLKHSFINRRWDYIPFPSGPRKCLEVAKKQVDLLACSNLL
ncbi:cytochrome P450 alkane hydroxylase, partial [Pyrenophora tritici-repentis]